MNMIQNAKDQVLDLTVSAYQKAAAEGLLPQDCGCDPVGGDSQGHRQRRLYHHLLPGRRQGPEARIPARWPRSCMDHMDLRGSAISPPWRWPGRAF